MKGQQHVIDMRMDRLKPLGVFVWVDVLPAKSWDENPHGFQEYPNVFIEPGERIDRLDFRWVIGLDVNVAADHLGRLAAVAHACRREQARRVISAHFIGNEIASMTNSKTGKQWLRPTT